MFRSDSSSADEIVLKERKKKANKKYSLKKKKLKINNATNSAEILM